MGQNAGRLILILGCLILILIMVLPLVKKSPEVREITIGHKKVKVELAKTEPERQKGLSGRDFLPEDVGLLFVFDKPGTYGIWMKEMNFAIDIIWISADQKVAEITADVSPDSFPRTYLPKLPVSRVLEVNAGWAKRNGVNSGDEVKIN